MIVIPIYSLATNHFSCVGKQHGMESSRTGNNDFSHRCQMVDEEGMRLVSDFSSWFSSTSSLHRFDTVDWVTGRTSACKNSHLNPKAFMKQMEEECRGETSKLG